VALDVLLDQRLAGLDRPFVHARHGVMDVAVEEPAMVGIEHDLADGRAGALGHHAVDHAFAFRHPGAGKPHRHILLPINCPSGRIISALEPIDGKKAKKLWLFKEA
jgi:hypothetical protein